ncbi:MAG TPA: DNA polymerase IV [Humisphaera sp.]|jgi:DNA polymerase-4|nr:DNA polymerase IV [Humisphaera sp.]
MISDRSILHVDMDAFFASVEQLDNPALRGKPVLVGHDGARGVVAAASYESRVFGCHSAQPMSIAKRLCPSAIIVPVRGERYREISRHVFDIFNQFSPVVEPLSVDEAFLDLTGTSRLLGEPRGVARKIKDTIKAQAGITASVGVAPNKFLAKLASDMQKPDGLVVIEPDAIDRILLPLAVTKLWGIGKATSARLANVGIRTIADLRRAPAELVQRYLGSETQRYLNLARGIDDRNVTPDREAKSISHEQTFGVDLIQPEEVRRVLLDQSEQVGWRLRRHGLQSRGVSVKIRFGNFETITRSATLKEPTDCTADLWTAARELFDAWTFQPVRLIGLTAERLSQGGDQMGLFADPARDRQRKLDAVADRINARYGKRSVRRGS